MKNIKNIAKGFLLLSFLVGVAMATPAKADNDGNKNGFMNAQASIKADVLARLESSVGVVLGPNSTLRVFGAKVASVAGSDISVTAPFGNSSLNFVVKTDASTKLNGNQSDTSIWSQLKAGDKISFAGTITSSTSSSITVDGDHIVSQVLFDRSAIADSDRDDDDDDKDDDGDKDDKKDKDNKKEDKESRGFWNRIFGWLRG